MKWTKIFKREKPINVMPEPKFEDNWKQEHYENNVKQGVASLQKGQEIRIMDDSSPMIVLTSIPAQKNVHCSKCDYVGYRIA